MSCSPQCHELFLPMCLCVSRLRVTITPHDSIPFSAPVIVMMPSVRHCQTSHTALRFVPMSHCCTTHRISLGHLETSLCVSQPPNHDIGLPAPGETIIYDLRGSRHLYDSSLCHAPSRRCAPGNLVEGLSAPLLSTYPIPRFVSIPG